MRTHAQMLSRKRATRVVSLVLIVVGAVTLVTTTLSANDLPAAPCSITLKLQCCGSSPPAICRSQQDLG